jgi:hypothetical protein
MPSGMTQIFFWCMDHRDPTPPRGSTTVTCQSAPVVPSGFEPLVAPLPAPELPPGFPPCAASMTPVVPHMAQASQAAPCTATPTVPRAAPESPAAPRASATPPAAMDGPPPRGWPSSTIVYTSTAPPAPKPQHAEQQTSEMAASAKDVVEANERPCTKVARPGSSNSSAIQRSVGSTACRDASCRRPAASQRCRSGRCSWTGRRRQPCHARRSSSRRSISRTAMDTSRRYRGACRASRWTTDQWWTTGASTARARFRRRHPRRRPQTTVAHPAPSQGSWASTRSRTGRRGMLGVTPRRWQRSSGDRRQSGCHRGNHHSSGSSTQPSLSVRRGSVGHNPRSDTCSQRSPQSSRSRLGSQALSMLRSPI